MYINRGAGDGEEKTTLVMGSTEQRTIGGKSKRKIPPKSRPSNRQRGEIYPNHSCVGEGPSCYREGKAGSKPGLRGHQRVRISRKRLSYCYICT